MYGRIGARGLAENSQIEKGDGAGAPVAPARIPVLLAWAQEAVLEALSPTRCICCERSGAVLCPECAAALERIDPSTACLRCGAPFGRLVCTECKGPLGLDWCLAAVSYRGLAEKIVRGYKDAGERRLSEVVAGFMAQALACGADREPQVAAFLAGASLVFVPATAAAYRRRGFDHMEEVARLVGAATGLPVVDVLGKHGAADQRLLGREERAARARGVYEVVAPVAGARLVLLDDVLTTGATMAAAAAALRDAGAASVAGLAFARVW